MTPSHKFELTREHFKNAYKERTENLAILKGLVDYYGLDLSKPEHQNFLNNLHYFCSGKIAGKKYFQTLTSVRLFTDEQENQEASSMDADVYLQLPNNKKMSFKLPDKDKVLMALGITNRDAAEHSTIDEDFSAPEDFDNLTLDESDSELTSDNSRAEPNSDNTANEFNEKHYAASIQALYNKKIEEYIKKLGLKSTGSDTFYQTFEGVAQHLKKTAVEKDSRVWAINNSSFFEEKPGLIRNFQAVFPSQIQKTTEELGHHIENQEVAPLLHGGEDNSKLRIYRCAAIARTKSATTNSTPLQSVLLEMEALAGMTESLIQMSYDSKMSENSSLPSRLVVTSLLSQGTNLALEAEHNAARRLNSIFEIEDVESKKTKLKVELDALKAKFDPNIKSLVKDESERKAILAEFNYLKDLITENIATINTLYEHEDKKTISVQHVNIGLNMLDKFYQPNKDTHHRDEIEQIIKKDVLSKTSDQDKNPLTIKDAQTKFNEAANETQLIDALLLKEHAADQYANADLLGTRYFYAALLQLSLANHGVHAEFHCESGKDRTSVVATFVTKLADMNSDALKELYNDPQKKLALMTAIQSDLVDLEGSTQKLMKKTETGMQGIKVTSTSVGIAAWLVGLLPRLSPQLALLTADIINIAVNIAIPFIKSYTSLKDLFSGKNKGFSLTKLGQQLQNKIEYDQHEAVSDIKTQLAFWLAQGKFAFGCLKEAAQSRSPTAFVHSVLCFGKLGFAVGTGAAISITAGINALVARMPDKTPLKEIKLGIGALCSSTIATLVAIQSLPFESFQQAGFLSYGNKRKLLEGNTSANPARSNRKKIDEQLKEQKDKKEKDITSPSLNPSRPAPSAQDQQQGLPSVQIRKKAKPATATDSEFDPSLDPINPPRQPSLPHSMEESRAYFQQSDNPNRWVYASTRTEDSDSSAKILKEAIFTLDKSFKDKFITQIHKIDETLQNKEVVKHLVDEAKNHLAPKEDEELEAVIEMPIKNDRDKANLQELITQLRSQGITSIIVNSKELTNKSAIDRKIIDDMVSNTNSGPYPVQTPSNQRSRKPQSPITNARNNLTGSSNTPRSPQKD